MKIKSLIGKLLNNFDFTQEYILCAANWYPDLDYILSSRTKEIPKNLYLPKGCDKGIVFCGLGHCQCMYQMIKTTGLRQAEAGLEVDGFLTSKNRFVERPEAREIALKSGQINKTNYSTEWLYSEDLYGMSENKKTN